MAPSHRGAATHGAHRPLAFAVDWICWILVIRVPAARHRPVPALPPAYFTGRILGESANSTGSLVLRRHTTYSIGGWRGPGRAQVHQYMSTGEDATAPPAPHMTSSSSSSRTADKKRRARRPWRGWTAVQVRSCLRGAGAPRRWPQHGSRSTGAGSTPATTAAHRGSRQGEPAAGKGSAGESSGRWWSSREELMRGRGRPVEMLIRHGWWIAAPPVRSCCRWVRFWSPPVLWFLQDDHQANHAQV
jgi:hypothetical protein